MSELSDAFCVFSGEASAGLLAFLPLIDVKEGGRRFFQVSIGLALATLALGQGIRAAAGGYAVADLATWRGAGLALALASAGGAGVSLRVIAGTAFERARPFLIATAALAVLAVLAEASSIAAARAPLGPASAVLVPLDFLAGTALLGSVSLAMILGHFYLVLPRLSITPLARLTRAYLVSVLARAALLAVALALAWNLTLPSGRPVLLEHAVLLLPRVLFGILGPLVLALLARGTVAIKSTQSATGILYGAVVFVAIGELCASWFASATGLPF